MNSSRAYIEVQRDGEIMTLLIARPDVHNALHAPAWIELGACLDAAEADAGVRVVIVSGKGDQAFSAGFDLKWAEQNPQVYADPMAASEIVRRPRRSKPVIAAVNGLAMGLGFEFALSCDLIVAARHAVFALPEPRVGLAAMGGGVVRLSRLLGLKQAMGIALSCRRVSAEEGFRIGFVNELAPGSAIDCARNWAADIVGAGPLAVAATMQMAEAAADMPLNDALDPRKHPAVMRVLGSADAQEGRRAFLERRLPVWTGR